MFLEIENFFCQAYALRKEAQVFQVTLETTEVELPLAQKSSTLRDDLPQKAIRYNLGNWFSDTYFSWEEHVILPLKNEIVKTT